MFPIATAALSFLDISDYWSREIRPPASKHELLGLLESAWWLGEIRGDSVLSRLELLKRMFKSMHDRDDLGIVFIAGEVDEPPQKLPDGCVAVDIRPRIVLPSTDADVWDEVACTDAFHALAQTSSTESYPEMTTGLAFIELTYNEFSSWLAARGYSKPKFWRPQQLKRPKRGRPTTTKLAGSDVGKRKRGRRAKKPEATKQAAQNPDYPNTRATVSRPKRLSVRTVKSFLREFIDDERKADRVPTLDRAYKAAIAAKIKGARPLIRTVFPELVSQAGYDPPRRGRPSNSQN